MTYQRSLVMGFMIAAALFMQQTLCALETNTSSMTTNTLPKVTAVNGQLALGDDILVEIDRLKEWAATPGNDPRKLVPYLNGRHVIGLFPEEIALSHNRLQFHLTITPENQTVWADLLREPIMRRPVSFTVGVENQAPFETTFHHTNKLALIIVPGFRGFVSLFVILLAFGAFAHLALKTGIIREPGPPLPDGRLRPYNLGRTQMALWFFLILTSYVVIWLITGNLDTITQSLLVLMGISAATALGAAVIDSNKAGAPAGSAPAPAPAVVPTTTLLPGAEARPPCPPPQASRGFLPDILSDCGSYSFHRFQIFAWTLVLAVIFVTSVYNKLKMPEFNATLLGLMGISAGTYIGFKIPEK
jgi:hypothetical protein